MGDFVDKIHTVSRRALLRSPSALAAGQRALARPTQMKLALHQNTSLGVGYRESIQGWARAGIGNVELAAPLVDEFLKRESIAAARRVITDSSLTAVSGNCGTLQGVWKPNENRRAYVDKFQRRCEMYAALGVPRVYTTTATDQKFALADYDAAIDNMREVGEIARRYEVVAMVEFVRTSSFISTLPTVLRLTRGAAHPNLRPMLDCYHFWSGLNKMENLDQIRPGEIEHVHFQDAPDIPREMLDYTTRVVPGDGICPLAAMLRKLSAKRYAGALSVEVFIPRFRSGNPFQTAREIRGKAEAVMRKAGVV
jgi:sugar phosphate isomerase/epimerase